MKEIVHLFFIRLLTIACILGFILICGCENDTECRGAPQLVEDPEFLEGLWVSLLRQ